MPQDTVWLNNTNSYILQQILGSQEATDNALIENIFTIQQNGTPYSYSFNPKNSPHNDSLLHYFLLPKHTFSKIKFDEEKAKYDKLSNIFEILIFIAFILSILYAIKRKKQREQNPFDEDESQWVEIGTVQTPYGEYFIDAGENFKRPTQPIIDYLTYNGNELNFTSQQISDVLLKRFPYYEKLGVAERIRFLKRHAAFMKTKIFKIHDKSGFKEMPILITATAIQLSFGLQEYLLPYYKNIHIFPQEFLGMHPTMRFLEGNVSGNDINISWKHYLEGYGNNNDGQNVGLHELAHAYYSQNFTFDGEKDTSFVNNFSEYNFIGNKIFEQGKINGCQLFSDYALKNFQEFWAESVEIFFEKGSQLKATYPDLYECISTLLNQETA